MTYTNELNKKDGNAIYHNYLESQFQNCETFSTCTNFDLATDESPGVEKISSGRSNVRLHVKIKKLGI